jgi:DNA-binding response OmpR family regulator
MAQRVLCVEDEPQMQTMLQDNLQYEGYEVLSAETGEQGIEMALRERPDLVLLDLMLPRMSGYEVCRKIRAAGFDIPIIMITARNTDLDRIAGLELGASDYLGKPFNVRELLARIRAQLRRTEQAGAEHPSQITFSDVVIDMRSREVRRGAHYLDLSSREFDLLNYFVTHPGEVLTRERILREVWNYRGLPQTRTVDNFVAKLRRKIEPDENDARHILTVHGVGYRFSR